MCDEDLLSNSDYDPFRILDRVHELGIPMVMAPTLGLRIPMGSDDWLGTHPDPTALTLLPFAVQFLRNHSPYYGAMPQSLLEVTFLASSLPVDDAISAVQKMIPQFSRDEARIFLRDTIAWVSGWSASA